MDDKEFTTSGVGLLEPSKPVDALPLTPVIQTLPSSLESTLPVPESADSTSIVARLHEFDTKRVGDDRRVRHERAKYINELIKTQSPNILIDTASHFMSVGEDGKIKESSSLKSLRDRLVKEKETELAASGMDKGAIVKEQVDLYKGMLTKAAEDLPDDKKAHYLSKRLTPNVAAKRRTLEGRNRSMKLETPIVALPVDIPVQEGSVSRRMVEQPKIAEAQSSLDRVGVAGRPLDDADKISLVTEEDRDKLHESIAVYLKEELDNKDLEGGQESSDRVKRYGRRVLRTVFLAGIIYTPMKSGEMVLNEQYPNTLSTHSTDISLDSPQMPSEKALPESGIQIESSAGPQANDSTLNDESTQSMVDESTTNSTQSETGEVNNAQPQVQGLGAKLRGFFGGNKNG